MRTVTTRKRHLLAAALAGALVVAFMFVPVAFAQTEEDAVRTTLSDYRAAIEQLDLARTPSLFAPDSQIVEQGHVEGSFDNYLANHLGPEIRDIASFDFTDENVEVAIFGDMALATETYSYRIALRDGRIIERVGVATSTLRRNDRGWRILRYHSSSRSPRQD